ncbi:hypothetical protein [Streptomyces alfalfae]
MSEQPPADDSAPDQEPEEEPAQSGQSEAPQPRPARRRYPQNDLARLTGLHPSIVGPGSVISQILRETSPMRQAVAQMRAMKISAPNGFLIQQVAESLASMHPRLNLVQSSPLLQVRAAALDLQRMYPQWDIRPFSPFTFPIPDDLEEDIDNDLEGLEEPARQFIREQGPLSWTEQRRLFAFFVMAFFFIVLMTAVVESEAAKELGEDAALVWPAAALAGVVAHKHWEKISPRPPGEEEEGEEEAEVG